MADPQDGWPKPSVRSIAIVSRLGQPVEGPDPRRYAGEFWTWLSPNTFSTNAYSSATSLNA